VAGTVKDGRNLARDAHTASGILGEFALTGLGYDYFWHFGLSFPCVGHGGAAFSCQLLAFSLLCSCELNRPLPLFKSSF
jgi:hypothetical protein